MCEMLHIMHMMNTTLLSVSISEDDFFVVEQITSGRLCSCYLLKV